MMERYSTQEDRGDYVMHADGYERQREFTFRRNGRWRRTFIRESDGRPRFLWHVRVMGHWVRVPWLAWAMFS